MTTYKLKTTFTPTILNIPEIKKFIGEDVEITIKKINKKLNSNKLNGYKKAIALVKKYNTSDRKLSEELIADRRLEAKNE